MLAVLLLSPCPGSVPVQHEPQPQPGAEHGPGLGPLQASFGGEGVTYSQKPNVVFFSRTLGALPDRCQRSVPRCPCGAGTDGRVLGGVEEKVAKIYLKIP